MYSDNFQASENISEPVLPLIKLTRWRYKHYTCAVYQLPNGDLVMSARQAAVPLGQSKENTKAFFQTYKLDTIRVRLPNRKIISAYSLPTVAIYWRYLLESHLIPQKLIDKFDWGELIDSLQDAHQQSEKQLITPKVTQKEENSTVLATQSAKPYLITAHSIVLKLQAKLQLEVLVLPEQEYRISYDAGLKIIGAYPGWLQELPSSPYRLKTLLKKGFSGLAKTCIINTEEKTEIVKCLSLSDWLTVWEVFAYRGNSKAAAVLKACAEETIPARVRAAIKPYSLRGDLPCSKAMV